MSKFQCNNECINMEVDSETVVEPNLPLCVRDVEMPSVSSSSDSESVASTREMLTSVEGSKQRRRNRNKARLRRGRMTENERKKQNEAAKLRMKAIRNSNIIKRGIKKFIDSMYDLKFNVCNVCKERVSTSFVVISGKCKRCALEKKEFGKFSAQNLMDPGVVPVELVGLTMIEELLIAQASPVVQVYRLRGGQSSYKGHVISFPQDVRKFAKELPRLPNDIDFVFVRKTFPDGHADFKIRREKIFSALTWLKGNNPCYKDITINTDRIDELPSYMNGQATEGVMMMEDEVSELQNIPSTSHSHVFGRKYVDEENEIKEKLLHLTNESTIDWPSTGIIATNEYTDEHFLSKCFPTLYPFGQADFRTPRRYTVHATEYFKHLLLYHDQRFAQHPVWRYYALNSTMRWTAMTQGKIFISQTKEDIPIKISDLRQKLNAGHFKEIACKIMHFGHTIRGTSEYWKARKKELFSMTSQLGPPAFFFTLSAADMQWHDLHSFMNNGIYSNDARFRAESVQKNPHICAWFLDTRVKHFVRDVFEKIFNVRDFWYRYEWQSRGSGHVHGFLWVEGSPNVKNLNLDDAEDAARVCEYFQPFITTWNPDPNAPAANTHPCGIDPRQIEDFESDYSNLLNCVQRHTRCSASYCLKQHRTSGQQKCRFGYPKQSIDVGHIAKINNKYELLTTRNDPLLNGHNKEQLQAWRANVDLKPVLSESAVMRYIAKYCCKSETQSEDLDNILGTILKNLEETDKSLKAIQKLLMKLIGERDYSAQEVSHLLMQIPLFHSTRSFVYVNTQLDKRHKLMKSKLRAEQDDDEASFSSIIEKYMNRCIAQPEMRNISLYNTAKCYKFSRGKFNKRLRGSDSIVCITPHIPKDKNDVNYCRQELILHKPFCKEQELIGEFNDYIEAYVNFFPPESDPVIVVDMSSDDEDWLEMDEAEPSFRQQWMTLVGLAPNSALYPEHEDLGRRPIDTLYDWSGSFIKYQDSETFGNYIETQKKLKHNSTMEPVGISLDLSEDQLEALDIFQNHSDLLPGDAATCPLLMIIQGTAGTGKSALIHRMLQVCSNQTKVLAYTGVAAFNIKGETIHSLLMLPLSKGEFHDLAGQPAKLLQENLRGTRYIIIDEYSFVGCVTLAQIDKRLRQAFPRKQEIPFGGCSLILVGDIAQLPPVGDTPLYKHVFAKSSMGKAGSALYQLFQTVVVLTTIHRQCGEKQERFRELLLRLRLGISTYEDWELLMTRRLSQLNSAESEKFRTATRLYTTNERVHRCNREMLESLRMPVARIPAVAKETSSYPGTLETILLLSIGCRAMLLRNLWTEEGLVNGAIGTVVDIVYRPEDDNTPLAVLVEFPTYNGPSVIPGKNVVPIVSKTETWQDANGVYHSITQIPLRLAYSISVHKSQSLTLKSIIIDIGEKEFSTGLSFVGYSRVRSIDDVAIETAYDFARLLNIGSSKNMQFICQEEKRLISLHEKRKNEAMLINLRI